MNVQLMNLGRHHAQKIDSDPKLPNCCAAKCVYFLGSLARWKRAFFVPQSLGLSLTMQSAIRLHKRLVAGAQLFMQGA